MSFPRTKLHTEYAAHQAHLTTQLSSQSSVDTNRHRYSSDDEENDTYDAKRARLDGVNVTRISPTDESRRRSSVMPQNIAADMRYNPGDAHYQLLQKLSALAETDEAVAALLPQARWTLTPQRQHPLLQSTLLCRTDVSTNTFVRKQKDLGAKKPITHALIWNSAMADTILRQRLPQYAQRVCGDSEALKIISVLSPTDQEAQFVGKTGHEIIPLQESGKSPYLSLSSYRHSLMQAIPLARTSAGDLACVAVHPGWGFISEDGNAELIIRHTNLAEQIKDALAFINERNLTTYLDLNAVQALPTIQDQLTHAKNNHDAVVTAYIDALENITAATHAATEASKQLKDDPTDLTVQTKQHALQAAETTLQQAKEALAPIKQRLDDHYTQIENYLDALSEAVHKPDLRKTRLVFMGPPAHAMEKLGDKRAAKEQALIAGLPIIRGSKGCVKSAEDALAFMETSDIQYPVLLKATAGGGGRGQRIVTCAEEMAAQFNSVLEDAKSFPSQDVILEEYLSREDNRHIEFQFIADGDGNVIILGERDCSPQIRQQKVVEETVEETVTTDERDRFLQQRIELRQQLIQMVQNVGYVGAGTAEFLYAKQTEGEARKFRFLEINTRLQVEHPVTERQRNLHLPTLQAAVAAGIPLIKNTDDIGIFSADEVAELEQTDSRHHVLAVRITATDPYESTGSTGTIETFRPPQNIDGMRHYFSVQKGSKITGKTDAQIGHLFFEGASRQDCIANALTALNQLKIEGIQTNVDFLITLLGSKEFQDNRIGIKTLETSFIPQHKKSRDADLKTAILAQAVQNFREIQQQKERAFKDAQDYNTRLPYLTQTRTLDVSHQGNNYSVTVTQVADNQYLVDNIPVQWTQLSPQQAQIKLGATTDTPLAHWHTLELKTQGTKSTVSVDRQPSVEFGDPFVFSSPSDGLVTQVCVTAGQAVKKGDLLYKAEIAKVSTDFTAPCDGVISTLNVHKNQGITKGQLAAEFKRPEDFVPPKPTVLWQALPMADLSVEQAVVSLQTGVHLTTTQLAPVQQALNKNIDSALTHYIAMAEGLLAYDATPREQVTIEQHMAHGNAHTQVKLVQKGLEHIATTEFNESQLAQLSNLLDRIAALADTTEGKTTYKVLIDAGKKLQQERGLIAVFDPKTASPLEIRQEAAQRLKTPYVYDYPQQMLDALKGLWDRLAPGQDYPDDFFTMREIELSDPTDENSDLQYCNHSSDGSNKLSVVAWEVTLHLPNETEPRKMIWCANDISVENGSMGIMDDKLALAAERYAVANQYPLSFYFCGAGARYHPNIDVKSKTQWGKNISAQLSPNELYLSQQDFDELNRGKRQVAGDLVTCEAGVFYQVTGISSKTNQSSLNGRLLQAPLQARREIPTFAAAVGPYVVGKQTYAYDQFRNTVQQNTTPALLTGMAAINAALGTKAYETNDEIGGPQVHTQSGVTSWAVDNFSDVLTRHLEWLRLQPTEPLTHDSVQKLVGQHPFVERPLETADIIRAGQGIVQPYDPTELVQQLVDPGSLLEERAEFGINIHTYRGLIGRIPIAIIVPDSRSLEQVQASDPAQPKSSAARTQMRSGSVWDPAGSAKTAAFIQKSHDEGVPLLLLPDLRGFKGDTTALLERIISAGSNIADGLSHYQHPVVVYLPPHSQLRGGAWAVMDPTINPNGRITMLADPHATMGVLEPVLAKTLPQVKRDMDAAVKSTTQQPGEDLATARSRVRQEQDELWHKVLELQDSPQGATLESANIQIVDTAHAQGAIYRAIVQGYGVAV